MRRDLMVAIALVKKADMGGAGAAAARATKAVGGGLMKAVRGGANLGGGFAEELVGPGGQAAGKIVGGVLPVAALAVGAHAAGREVKNRVDQWRVQHGLYPTPPVQYY
jgi:hypothetical protein